MAIFGAASKIRLVSCRAELQAIANEAIKSVEFVVQEGHRNQEDQEKAFAEGRTQKHWPDGNHNKLPSDAYDLVPISTELDVWKIDDPAVQVLWWKLAYALLRAAEKLGYKLRWGNDWNSDGNTADTKLKDWPHWELV